MTRKDEPTEVAERLLSRREILTLAGDVSLVLGTAGALAACATTGATAGDPHENGLTKTADSTGGERPTSLMMSSLAEIRASPLAPAARDEAPLFLHVDLQEQPPVVQLTYAAQRALEDSSQPDGRSLILSLFKRMHSDQGAQFRWPEVVAAFPTVHGEAPDSNYRLLVEAMTVFCMPLRRAVECTHFDGVVAHELGYELASVSVLSHKSALCLYQPTDSTQQVDFSP